LLILKEAVLVLVSEGVYKCNGWPSLCAVGIVGAQVVHLIPDEINIVS